MSAVAAAEEPVGRNEAGASPVRTDGRMGKFLLALASTVILCYESHGPCARRFSATFLFPAADLTENSQIWYEIYSTLFPVCTVATAAEAIKSLITNPFA
jgi:hypothetical protein